MNHATGKIASRAGAWRHLAQQILADTGSFARAQWDELRHTAAVIGTVFYTWVRPRHWARAVRKAFALQILSIGIEPLWFVGAVAVFAGISVVVQLTFWTGEVGQSLSNGKPPDASGLAMICPYLKACEFKTGGHESGAGVAYTVEVMPVFHPWRFIATVDF